MTRDDIIRMALEAGGDFDDDVWLFMADELEHFAALVAAAEREECAKVAEYKFIGAKDGREQCGGEIATAIRARGQG
jgi:hypothetical protein